MLNIQTKLTPYNFTDTNNINRIKYIVIHYTGAVGSAKNNATYFASKYVGASAHYFVDEVSIWQSVRDGDSAWHCGGKLQGNKYHEWYKKCLNSNSIGIEMCVSKNSNGELYFKQETIKNTVDLVQYLMSKYHVPLDNVVRHADVTGKICPKPFCYSEDNDRAWEEFKRLVGGKMSFKITDCEIVGKVVNASVLNVRDCPDTNGKVIGKLALNDTVWINGKCDNGWYRADFVGTCGTGYFSGDYIQIISEKTLNHSYDNTVNNMIVDGVTTEENMQYWELVLSGKEPVNLEYLRAILNRYHDKI